METDFKSDVQWFDVYKPQQLQHIDDKYNQNKSRHYYMINYQNSANEIN